MSAIPPQTNAIKKTISNLLHVLILAKKAFLILFSSYCDSLGNCNACNQEKQYLISCMSWSCQILKEAFLILFSSYCDSLNNCNACTLCYYKPGKCTPCTAFKQCVKAHGDASAAKKFA